MSMQLPRKLPFMHTSFIPEREFDPIANANLVVNHAEVIPNNMRINSQLLATSRFVSPAATSSITACCRGLGLRLSSRKGTIS